MTLTPRLQQPAQALGLRYASSKVGWEIYNPYSCRFPSLFISFLQNLSCPRLAH